MRWLVLCLARGNAMLWVLALLLSDGSFAGMTQHALPRLPCHSRLHSHVTSMVVSAQASTDTNYLVLLFDRRLFAKGSGQATDILQRQGCCGACVFTHIYAMQKRNTSNESYAHLKRRRTSFFRTFPAVSLCLSFKAGCVRTTQINRE